MQYKRKIHVLELEAAEWREKCKYLEMRKYNTDANRVFDIRRGSKEEHEVRDGNST